MAKLVSVIIPCFNAEKWLAEAIDSCLKQTYPNIEIIVVDDGSTDTSVEIIQSYGDQITWITGPHQGGNSARNRGFTLSQGDYIQFLDADDYILPEKIARQVAYLEETGADAVYGDWRYQYHLKTGEVQLSDIELSGAQSDLLESLLSTWWVAVASLLYQRKSVEQCGGWDETLQAAQDRDFLIAIALTGAQVIYQPGCYAIYRRYGSTTVSTSRMSVWLESHDRLMKKAEKQLSELDRLTFKYQCALAQSYFFLARNSIKFDSRYYSQFLEKTLDLFPEFQATNQGLIYTLIQTCFGFRQAESLTYRILLLKKRLKQVVFNYLKPNHRFGTAS